MVSEELHLCALVFAADTLPHILHTVRHQDGSWDQFQDITQPDLAAFPALLWPSTAQLHGREAAIARLWRHEDGDCGIPALGQKQWSRFEDVKALSSNNPGAFTDVRIASTTGQTSYLRSAGGRPMAYYPVHQSHPLARRIR